MLYPLGWALLAFLCGSLPFSVWLPRLAGGRDARQFGDGNPGATNAFRAGGAGVGLAVLLLDISKAAAPVGMAYFQFGWRGWPMLLIATAPVLGHAFSPFLRFRGGKALAPAFGAWIGLTLWQLSLPVLLLVLLWRAALDVDGWAVLLALASLLVIILVWQPELLFLAVLAGQMVILAYTHRAGLRRRPHWRLGRGRPSAG
ncbi:Glycerol-3-phosphate acyltransferase [Candidatus Promineifilum breve]|uniref:Glycerol-3-phosphate acyltransferase n=1 Tax=Candidatus Promineifilum breve TaxID=1806508 RepID=A0A161KB17_9CHLR|nr:glycerol-3-phosphate acyltransferase [Candidatus Promineifilum breve]CUS04883.2 Glycerol-3-phosphate acyltransferase [Candidatus Promineifilum breve]